MEELFSYEHSGKLLGLVEMLTECEIIQQTEPQEPKAEEGAHLMFEQAFGGQISRPHRALIFCQMGSMLQLIVD